VGSDYLGCEETTAFERTRLSLEIAFLIKTTIRLKAIKQFFLTLLSFTITIFPFFRIKFFFLIQIDRVSAAFAKVAIIVSLRLS